MSRKLTLEITLLLSVGAILTLMGCSYRVSDAEWANTVPGLYEVSKAGIQEKIDLQPGGNFRHQVLVGGKSVLTESGKWSFDVQAGSVLVEPFTSFFDRRDRKIVTEGVRRSQDSLFVMRYGTAAERISPSVDFDYVLRRKNVASPGRNAGEGSNGSASTRTNEPYPQNK